MSGVKSLKQSLIVIASILISSVSIMATRLPDTAAYFSALKSFNANGDAFEAEFRNGLKVIIEEAYGIPLAVLNAVVTFPAGQLRSENLAATAQSCINTIEPGILAIGGMVNSTPGSGCIIISIAVPADETGRVFELLGGFAVPVANSIAPSPPDSWRERENEINDLDYSRLLALTLESLEGREGRTADSTLSPPGNPGLISALVITGSVQHEKLLSQIAKFFPAKREVTALSASGDPLKFDQASLNRSVDYAHFETKLDFPSFTCSFRVPPPGHPRRTAVEVLEKIIGGGLAGLLRTDEEELALNFQYRSEIVERDSSSYLVLSAAVHPDYLDRIEMMILGTLSLLGKNELPVSLVNRGKTLALMDSFLELDSLPARAEGWTRRLLRAGPLRNREFSRQMIAGIEADDLMSAAAAFLSPHQAFIREFIPSGFSRNFNSETFGETVGILLPPAETAAGQRLEKYGFVEPQLAFLIPEIPVNVIPPELKKSSVLRGPDIHIYETHSAPLVRLGIFFPGGITAEGKGNPGMTEMLVSSMLQHWAVNGLAPRIVGLEGNGCLLEGIVKPDYFGFRATILSSSFERAFSEIINLIKAFPVEDSFPLKFRNSRKFSEFLGISTIPERIPDYLLSVQYSPSAGEGESGADSEKKETLSSWYKKYSGIHPDIVIYGDVKGTSFLRLMVPLLSNSSLKKPDRPSRRNRGTSKIKPLPLPIPEGKGCGLITSGLPGNSGREESLRIISRSLDGSGTSLEWIMLVKNGYGILKSKGDDGGNCDLPPLLRNLGKKKFSEREFNQSKVRAITSFYLQSECPAEMLDNIVVEFLSGAEGDFLRQLLVDLKQVRVIEVESVLENLFGE